MIVVLAILWFSVFTQSVGAPALFDKGVLLNWKSNPELRTLLHEPTSHGYGRVNVLLVFDSVPTADELTVLNGLSEIRTFTGHVATVNSPINLLPQIASLPFVTRLAKPRILKPELDVSVPEILADQVWNTAKYPGVRDSSGRAVIGTGVIIGFDDITGINYQHKDFIFPNGTNKVLYIWDQSSAGIPPDGYTYGNECDHSQIQAQTCGELDLSPNSVDTTGHGTAVAAVAASTGEASNNYYGVAPGASIIEVKLKDGTENSVIDAIHYMITKAQQLNRPLVIVHSFGDSLGSHDGTEPLELAFTDFVSQGVPIVVSAGNDRAASLHVSGYLSPGDSVHVPWSMSDAISQIDLWFPVSNTLSLSVVTPSGAIVSGPTPDIGVQTSDGNVIISPYMRPSGKEWWINVAATTQASRPTSLWTFVLTSISGPEGRWDAWTEPGQFVGSNETTTRKYLIDSSDTIDAPGTARGVVTVGAYMSKFSWWAKCTVCIRWAGENGYMGYWWTPTYAVGEGQLLYFNTSKQAVRTVLVGGSGVGQLLYFSGAGPTRDGRMKPELDAPGANIATARATTAAQRYSDPDNYHQVWVGTSFAAPHVGGVIALMLQMNPYLSPAEIITILQSDARQDNFTAPINRLVGSPLWGWGKVNALRSTIDSPGVYSVRFQVSSVNSVSDNLTTDVTLDGALVGTITLNESKTHALEFKSGATHVLQLTSIIDAKPGTRYILRDAQWTFSSGGTKNFAYQLQYYLQVNSQYGSTTGAGWYDANTNATVSVYPTTVGSHDFLGWSGAIITNSPNFTIKMEASKQVTANWSPALPAVTNQSYAPAPVALLIALLVVASALALGFILRRRGRLRQHPSAG